MQLATVFPFARRLFKQQAPDKSSASAGRFERSPIVPSYSASSLSSDPDLILSAIGWRRWDLRRLETDDEIFGDLSTRRDALTATPWRLEPGTGAVADFLYEQLAPHIENIMAVLWTALPYGFSVCDVTYARTEGGAIGIDSISDMPIELFRFDSRGQLIYFRPGGNPNGELADTKYKLIVSRHRASAKNQYGEALLSRLYWPWYFRHNLWRFRMEYLERFIDPILTGKVASPPAFIEAMQKLGFRSMVGVGKDEEVKAELASNAGEHESASRALDARIQKAILGQTLTTEIGDRGSFAAAQVHNLVRIDKRNADLRMIKPGIQTIVDALLELNGKERGSILFEIGDGVGLEPERAKRDAEFLNTGKVKLTTDYFLRAYDFEEGEIEAIEPQPVPAPFARKPPGNGGDGDEEAADGESSFTYRRDMLALSLFASRVSSGSGAPPIHVHMPKQEAPSVTMAAPVVNLEAPQPTPQPINIDVHVPEQSPPVVNVAPATVNVQPPAVTIEATLPAPEISVVLPPRKSETTIERDKAGNIVRTEQIERDAE